MTQRGIPDAFRRMFEKILPKVGLTARERLEWAVWFAQEDLGSTTPGDLLKLREELTAFKLGDGGPGIGGTGDEVDLVTEAELREAHAAFRQILSAFITKGQADIGEFSIDFRVWRHDPDQFPTLKSRRYRPSFEPPLPRLETTDEELRFTLGLRLNAYGHLVRACPAPVPRGRQGEACGRWFVADRPNKDYCSRRCQGRAATRAARARRGVGTGRKARRRPTGGK